MRILHLLASQSLHIVMKTHSSLSARPYTPARISRSAAHVSIGFKETPVCNHCGAFVFIRQILERFSCLQPDAVWYVLPVERQGA